MHGKVLKTNPYPNSLKNREKINLVLPWVWNPIINVLEQFWNNYGRERTSDLRIYILYNP